MKKVLLSYPSSSGSGRGSWEEGRDQDHLHLPCHWELIFPTHSTSPPCSSTFALIAHLFHPDNSMNNQNQSVLLQSLDCSHVKKEFVCWALVESHSPRLGCKTCFSHNARLVFPGGSYCGGGELPRDYFMVLSCPCPLTPGHLLPAPGPSLVLVSCSPGGDHLCDHGRPLLSSGTDARGCL